MDLIGIHPTDKTEEIFLAPCTKTLCLIIYDRLEKRQCIYLYFFTCELHMGIISFLSMKENIIDLGALECAAF